MGWLWFPLRWMRRGVALVVIVALLATNVLAFTSAAFVSAVSGLAAAAGLSTVQARQAAARRAVVRRIGQRTARGAARSAGATVAQSLPFVGVASVVGVTAWELSDYCETMTDLAALDPTAAADAESVCGMALPTEAAVYASVRASAGQWLSPLWRWPYGAEPAPGEDAAR